MGLDGWGLGLGSLEVLEGSLVLLELCGRLRREEPGWVVLPVELRRGREVFRDSLGREVMVAKPRGGSPSWEPLWVGERSFVTVTVVSFVVRLRNGMEEEPFLREDRLSVRLERGLVNCVTSRSTSANERGSIEALDGAEGSATMGDVMRSTGGLLLSSLAGGLLLAARLAMSAKDGTEEIGFLDSVVESRDGFLPLEEERLREPVAGFMNVPVIFGSGALSRPRFRSDFRGLELAAAMVSSKGYRDARGLVFDSAGARELVMRSWIGRLTRIGSVLLGAGAPSITFSFWLSFLPPLVTILTMTGERGPSDCAFSMDVRACMGSRTKLAYCWASISMLVSSLTMRLRSISICRCRSLYFRSVETSCCCLL